MVHGGTRFTAPTLITDEVLAEIEELVPLAPLHNPANITGIQVARALRPDLPQVAVFDTAFHATMPEAAARYAIDAATADRYGIRRYGFHGTSHAYVSRATAALLGKEPADVNVIVLHLGNGASASAVRGGRCVDTSMGLTPLEGLVMGTRSGDLDPAVVFHLERVGGMGTDEIDSLLNKRSGLLGPVRRQRHAGDRPPDGARATRPRASPSTSTCTGCAATSARSRRCSAGWTPWPSPPASARTRAAVRGGRHGGPGALGIVMDPVRNAVRSGAARMISADDSRVAVAVVPTDEELEIARDTYALARG